MPALHGVDKDIFRLRYS